MAFAPAFWQEDNNVWLNTVVGDIIQTNELTNRAGLCRTAGYDQHEDLIEVPWDEEFLRKPPEAASRASLTSSIREKSRSMSIAELDESIKRGGTPNSLSSWPKRRSRQQPSSDEPRELHRVQSDTAVHTASQFQYHQPTSEYFPPHPAVLRHSRRWGSESNSWSAMSKHSSLSDRDWEEPLRSGDSSSQRAHSPTSPRESTEDYPSSWKLTLIVVGLCLAVFLISVDRSIITTAIPQITDDFGSYDDIGWYGSAYLMTACAFQPLYGRVYMSFATKSSFLVALGIFEVGSLICALAPSSIPLIIGRSIQGLGSAGVLTGSFLVCTQSVALEKRPVFFAAIGILYGVGATVGPLLGGVFTDKASWRWCFYFNLPIGVITFVSMMLFFRPKVEQSTCRRGFLGRLLELDLISNMLLLAACIMIFVALEAPDQGYSWTSARVIGLFAGGGCTALLLISWQWYMGDKALLPPKIVSQRTVVCSCIIAVLVYGVLGMHAYFLPIWFEAVEGDSAIRAGVDMIPYMLANAVFGLLAGIFVSKNGYFTPPAIIGCAIGTVGCGLLSLLHVSTPSSHWIGYQIVASTGLGMAVQQGFIAVQTVLPLPQIPIGTAAVVASQSLGGAIFISVANTIFERTLLDQITSNAVTADINTTTLTTTGITTFRSTVSGEQLQLLLTFYNNSLTKVFIACVPLAGLAFLASLGLEWRSVKTEKSVSDPEKT